MYVGTLSGQAGTDAATWLQASLEQPWGRGDKANYTAAIIPRGFESYTRLLHPGSLALHKVVSLYSLELCFQSAA
ncbi:hypothetical protein PAT3040_00964 [Paenibacillus agaridevorans]|uniref:Uncharacterized protein n=1 Tax=Paenibacillus agaridevorans TaxID=171404 RepID=A0A2R5EIT4_9BACL|nr:hypothetical protein PAT3040_00964 [Paenibacillus agaridevorans]